MMSQNKRLTGLSSPSRFKNRRTSLNVNLSYTSNTSLLTEDETIAASSICDQNCDASLEKTIIVRRELPVRRTLSMKRFVSGKQVSNGKISEDQNMTRMKSSFVKMVRISTSTPRKLVDEQISEDTLFPSENTKRSNVLEDVRFPLDGEIFSPSASVVMETSMDMTEVQGGAILNSEPIASEMLNVCPDVNRGNDSLGVIQDTEDLSYYVQEERMGAVVIPDSEQDSINTIRTSLNVNTSLDSRFSSIPNNSLYDPKKSRHGEFGQDAIAENHLEDILFNPTSESSYGNVPMNSIVVTTAIVEHENLLNNTNYQKNLDQETTIDLESERESHPLQDTPLQSKNDKSDGGEHSDNDSSSSEASSSMNQDRQNFHLRISNDEDDIGESVIPGNLVRKPNRKGKKKLLTLHRSEMVDLSPVSADIVPVKRTFPKTRGRRRNKAAKKIVNIKNDTSKKPAAAVYTSDDCEDEVDPEPRKEKRVRKVKTMKIVINKMADLDLWKRMNENTNTVDKSCDDISSALGRTSLDDFELKKDFIRHKNRKLKPKIIIVATGLPIEQKILVKGTVTTLGSAKLDKIVTRNTTHVVSKGTRTVNLLRGIVRGCWLVSFEWILKSREAGKWVDPEKYEITGFSKAVQENRKEKQLFGAAYVSELFLTCGLIHIKEETCTPAPVLKELVRIAGGRVAAKPEEAKIIIGRGGFKEIWILDSIANGEVQPLEHYSKKKMLN